MTTFGRALLLIVGLTLALPAVASAQRTGHVSSAVPWWTSTGTVIRSKKVRGETSAQKSGCVRGVPWRSSMRSASWGLPPRVHFLWLSNVSELTEA